MQEFAVDLYSSIEVFLALLKQNVIQMLNVNHPATQLLTQPLDGILTNFEQRISLNDEIKRIWKQVNTRQHPIVRFQTHKQENAQLVLCYTFSDSAEKATKKSYTKEFGPLWKQKV